MRNGLRSRRFFGTRVSAGKPADVRRVTRQPLFVSAAPLLCVCRCLCPSAAL